MADLPDRDSVEFLLSQICRLHHGRAHTILDEIGLYRGQPHLLHILHKEDGLTQTDLAHRLQVTPATVTKMLKRMEKAGFVRRQADMADQRVSRVYLTEAGRAIKAEMIKALKKLDGEALAGFSTEERLLLRRFMVQIRDNLERASGERLSV